MNDIRIYVQWDRALNFRILYLVLFYAIHQNEWKIIINLKLKALIDCQGQRFLYMVNGQARCTHFTQFSMVRYEKELSWIFFRILWPMPRTLHWNMQNDISSIFLGMRFFQQDHQTVVNLSYSVLFPTCNYTFYVSFLKKCFEQFSVSRFHNLHRTDDLESLISKLCLNQNDIFQIDSLHWIYSLFIAFYAFGKTTRA